MMQSGNRAGWSALRLLAAVVFVVLGITGIHGAGSPAVPAGAILTEHASVGAALVQPTPSAGRDEALLIRAAGQADQAEEFDQPQEPSTAEALTGAVPEPPTRSTVAVAERQQALLPGDDLHHQGRAPPA